MFIAMLRSRSIKLIERGGSSRDITPLEEMSQRPTAARLLGRLF
jgi:hypothetical protein